MATADKADNSPAGADAKVKAKARKVLARKYARGEPIATNKVASKRLKNTLRYTEKVFEDAREGAALVEEWLLPSEGGSLEAEGLERTWQFSQPAIAGAVGAGAAAKSWDLQLPELGPYGVDCTREGRHLLLSGRKGHLALLDRLSLSPVCEVQVRETVRSACFLHSSAFFAAAQKRRTFIYDSRGIEIHALDAHGEVERLAYLPHHFLLASAARGGALTWQDTSTGRLVAQHRQPKGVAATCLAANPGSGVLAAGLAAGAVALWTPNQSAPVLRLLCHRGPLTALAWDAAGRTLVTAGADCQVKVWDVRALKPLHSYFARAAPAALDVSQRGMLAVASGRGIQVWRDALGGSSGRSIGQSRTAQDNKALGQPKAQAPYLTHSLPLGACVGLRFCPYDDVLLAGHAGGAAALLVPGAGEPNYDSFVADPYAGRAARREGEVRALLDKIQPEAIVLDPDSVGALARTPAEVQREAAALARAARGEDRVRAEEVVGERTKMKGKNKPTRRARRKQLNIFEEKKADMRDRAAAKEDGGRGSGRAARGERFAAASENVPRALHRFVAKLRK